MNSIEIGEKTIHYSLTRSKRKTLGLAVNSNGQLIITAPEFVSLAKIEEVMRKKKSWISKKIREKSQNAQIQPKRQFVSGESVYLFGKQYYLKIIKSNDFHVEKNREVLSFYMKDTSKADKVVSNWLAEQFKEKVFELTTQCLDRFQELHSASVRPKFKIRRMSKRWGSCSRDGVILLNSRLVTASVDCIEYVIFHELSHLLHRDHSLEFFRVLRKVCPNYKFTKEKLDESVLFEEQKLNESGIKEPIRAGLNRQTKRL